MTFLERKKQLKKQPLLSILSLIIFSVELFMLFKTDN